MKHLAQINLAPQGGYKGPGSGLLSTPGVTPENTIDRVISITVGVITVVGFIYFIIQIVSAAISWIGSSGDSKKVSDAQKKIQQSIIGLVVLVSATFLISLIGNILGIDILNLPELIGNL